MIIGILAILISAGSGLALSDWKQITVDDSLLNSTSDVAYTLMVPPGYTEKTADASYGVTTTLFNETDLNSLYIIGILDNPLGQLISGQDSSKMISDVMNYAEVTPIEGTEPLDLGNGAMVSYGTKDNLIAGSYFRTTDDKLISVIGIYKTREYASAEEETLINIGNSVTLINASKNNQSERPNDFRAEAAEIDISGLNEKHKQLRTPSPSRTESSSSIENQCPRSPDNCNKTCGGISYNQTNQTCEVTYTTIESSSCGTCPIGWNGPDYDCICTRLIPISTPEPAKSWKIPKSIKPVPTTKPTARTTTIPVEEKVYVPVVETTTIPVEETVYVPVVETTTIPVEETVYVPVVETITVPVEAPVETTVVETVTCGGCPGGWEGPDENCNCWQWVEVSE